MQQRELAAHAAGLRFTDQIRELERAGLTVGMIAAELGVSAPTVYRWQRRRVRFDAGEERALIPGKSTGRRALREWPAEDVQAIREIYLRTNLAKDTGSMSMAKRIALTRGLLTPETTALLKREVASKHYIPASLRRELQIAPATFRHHRHPRNAVLAGAYVPGGTRLAWDGSRRLYYGERFSFDDGSQNQIVCVPWPWGGTKEADKFGIRTCRGQWLVAHDDATSNVDAWVFTLRPRDSYRDPDAMGLVWKVCRDVAHMDEAVCEGGVWQSKRAQAFYRAAGIRVINAKGRPHMKLIENWWGRAWTFLSHYPDGQVGRFRGEYQRESDLLMRCQDGTVDGREHFPMLPALLAEFDECIRFLNQDRIESDQYGKWVPAERKALDLVERPRGRIALDLSTFAAPEAHVVTVRRHGMVLCKTVCPLGVDHPYMFADEALMPHEGRRVRVLWDPYESPVRAAILAEDATGDYKPGDLIATLCCINPPPIARSSTGWEVVRDPFGLSVGMAAKKGIGRAVRSEYRALGEGGRVAVQQTEIRGPDGSVLRAGTLAGDGASATLAPNAEQGTRNAEQKTEDGNEAAAPMRSRFELVGA